MGPAFTVYQQTVSRFIDQCVCFGSSFPTFDLHACIRTDLPSSQAFPIVFGILKSVRHLDMSAMLRPLE